MKFKLTKDKGNAVGSNYLKYNVCQVRADLTNELHCALAQLHEEFFRSFTFKKA